MKRYLQNVKVIPSVSLCSDHRLVVAILNLKKENPINPTQEKRIKSFKLKDAIVAENFRSEIQQHIPNNEFTSIEQEWTNFKTAIVKAAEKVCKRTSGKRKSKETPWWNDEAKAATKNKNDAFRKYFQLRTDEAKEEYKHAKREAKRVIERVQRSWFEEWGKSWKKM
ncbi:hypothetical protein M8J77_013306 [Diaphorina citri]|nr:hypothetical protein M8J77_013306 [Diaphorina citri]